MLAAMVKLEVFSYSYGYWKAMVAVSVFEMKVIFEPHGL